MICLHNKIKRGGFTLIELLVVISIIGLLSSIVLASLNSARKKAQDAAIVSNLRNFMSEAEMSRLNINDYSYINNGILPVKMIDGIQKANGISSCLSGGASSIPIIYSAEYYTRWACSGTNSDKSKLWSVSSDSNRVVTWDERLTVKETWLDAFTACANTGSRLPNIEELATARTTVGRQTDDDSGTASFASGTYWSSTTGNSDKYALVMMTNLTGSNTVVDGTKTDLFYVRCVR